MSDTPIYDRLFQRATKAHRSMRVLWASADHFKDVNRPTMDEIRAMTEYTGTVSFYYETPDEMAARAEAAGIEVWRYEE